MQLSKHADAPLWPYVMLLILGLAFPAMANAQTVRLAVSPKRLSYGDVPLGSHATLTMSATNDSSVDIDITSILASPNPTFVVSNSTCPVSPNLLPAGDSCLVSVDFVPQGTGKVTGVLTFTDSASNSPQDVRLVGTGVP
jgi:hypothetical protein